MGAILEVILDAASTLFDVIDSLKNRRNSDDEHQGGRA